MQYIEGACPVSTIDQVLSCSCFRCGVANEVKTRLKQGTDISWEGCVSAGNGLKWYVFSFSTIFYHFAESTCFNCAIYRGTL